MKLTFDDNEFKTLLSKLKIENCCGWFSINSIVGLSQLNNKVGFIGKINDDELGNKYQEGLEKEKVSYFYSKKRITAYWNLLDINNSRPERTMFTYLE